MEAGEEDSHISVVLDRIIVMQEEIDDIDFENLYERKNIGDKEPSVSKSEKKYLSANDYPIFKDEEQANDVSSSRDTYDLPILFNHQNNYFWSMKTPELDRVIAVPRIPAGDGQGASIRSPLESWALFMTDEMLLNIVMCTNEQILYLNKDTSVEKYDEYTNLKEIKAFIGLLYFMGLQGISHLSIKRLWSSLVSPVYRITMPSNRFIFLLENIKFDKKNTRSTYKTTDKLAPIRELWNELIHNCSKYYNPGENCTIDVQSLCLNRPRRFGIHDFNDSDKMEIIMLNDGYTFYMYNALPVIETPVLASETIGSYYLRVLCEPLYGSFRNIICDNYFTSVPIVDKMENEYNLTVTGTIKKDEPEIPIHMTKAGSKGTSTFAYNDNKILVSFCPRKNKIVLLLSSFHELDKIFSKMDTSEIDILEFIEYSYENSKTSSNTNIPEIIEYYNDFKDTSDIFSQMCDLYSTAHYTQHWSSRFFYAMLDISGINSYILYQLNINNISKSRYIFLEEVAYELIKPLLCERLSTTAIQNERYMIKNFLKNFTIRVQMKSEDNKLNYRCNFCMREKDKKARYICLICKEPCCKKHRSILCVNCAPSKL